MFFFFSGLKHTFERFSLMFPFSSGYGSQGHFELPKVDRVAVQSIYGRWSVPEGLKLVLRVIEKLSAGLFNRNWVHSEGHQPLGGHFLAE